jgi:hypothetical protein
MTVISNTDLASSLTSYKKDNRVKWDTKTFLCIKDIAMRSLDIKFKIHTVLGTSRVNGSENPDLKTSEMAVVFAENVHMLEQILKIIVQCNMYSATKIQMVADETAIHPANNYESEYTNIAQDIDVLDLAEVKEYSGDVMQFDKEGLNRQNLAWLLLLIQNNISSSIAALVEPGFKELKIRYKNGAISLKLVLDLYISINDHGIEPLHAYV